MGREQAHRRIISAVQRVEAEPRSYIPSRRQPRLAADADTVVIYYAEPSGSVAAATGTWPSLTAGTVTADVYASGSGSLILAFTAATIRNWMKDPTGAGHRLVLKPNGDGTFDVANEGCT